jgi:tetrahydromethanopterin S-methyltransferase subunit G
MAGIQTTKLERENLEAHVDLCAERYSQLESRLSNLEQKVEHIHTDIVHGQKSLSKVIITTTGTVIAGLISTVVVILMKMPG